MFYREPTGRSGIFWDASEPPGVSHLHRDSWTGRTQAPLAMSSPVTMTSTPNQHVFYVARDRSIRHIFWDASEPPNVLHADTWTLPSPPRAVGRPATMVTVAPNQQHVFHRASDGSIRHIFWYASGPAGTAYLYRDSWTALARSPPAAGDPATMVTTTPNQQHIFYRAADRSIQHIFWDAREAPGALHADSWTVLPDQVVMSPADWFTPYRKIWQDITDMDLGSAGAMLIPRSDYLVAGGKEGILYLLNRDHLGKFEDSNPPFDPASVAGFTNTDKPDDPNRDRVAQSYVGIDQYCAHFRRRYCFKGRPEWAKLDPNARTKWRHHGLLDRGRTSTPAPGVRRPVAVARFLRRPGKTPKSFS